MERIVLKSSSGKSSWGAPDEDPPEELLRRILLRSILLRRVGDFPEESPARYRASSSLPQDADVSTLRMYIWGVGIESMPVCVCVCVWERESTCVRVYYKCYVCICKVHSMSGVGRGVGTDSLLPVYLCECVWERVCECACVLWMLRTCMCKANLDVRSGDWLYACIFVCVCVRESLCACVLQMLHTCVWRNTNAFASEEEIEEENKTFYIHVRCGNWLYACMCMCVREKKREYVRACLLKMLHTCM